MHRNNSLILPVNEYHRIVSLDVLRGFAVLGILLMNIQSFSMPESAYLNPTSYGDFSGINRWVWGFTHVFADMKFMSIFSILFGAGIVLYTSRLREKQLPEVPIFYRRIFWLFLIGLVHAYLIWHGDILVVYALCAISVFWYRRLKSRTLFILGAVFIAIPVIINIMMALAIPNMSESEVAQFMNIWNPGQDAIARQLEAFRASYSKQLPFRVHSASGMHTVAFFVLYGWRAGGLMCVGMALLKKGILSARRDSTFYIKGLLMAGIPGLLLIGWGIRHNFVDGWSLAGSMYLGSNFNFIGSVGLAFAYICLIMYCCRTQVFGGFKRRLAAAGRMALSNYLVQSILCTAIFYGWGLGLYGRVERWEQLLIVLGIWILQLFGSSFWLSRYYYGPAEWLWRSLTYMSWQPFFRT